MKPAQCKQARAQCERVDLERSVLQGTLQAFDVNLIGRTDAQARKWELRKLNAAQLLEDFEGGREERVELLREYGLWTPIMENYLVKQDLLAPAPGRRTSPQSSPRSADELIRSLDQEARGEDEPSDG